MKTKSDSTDVIHLPAAPELVERKTVDAHARELGTPDWLVAALKHHFGRQQKTEVTLVEFNSAAAAIANHPIGGRR
jgi:hypothetical protein